MAKKKQKMKAAVRKPKQNPAPKLEEQGRDIVPPPSANNLYGTEKDPAVQQTKDVKELARDWFKAAKDSAKPDGKFMGVADVYIDPKDYCDSLQKDDKKE